MEVTEEKLEYALGLLLPREGHTINIKTAPWGRLRSWMERRKVTPMEYFWWVGWDRYKRRQFAYLRRINYLNAKSTRDSYLEYRDARIVMFTKLNPRLADQLRRLKLPPASVLADCPLDVNPAVLLNFLIETTPDKAVAPEGQPYEKVLMDAVEFLTFHPHARLGLVALQKHEEEHGRFALA